MLGEWLRKKRESIRIPEWLAQKGSQKELERRLSANEHEIPIESVHFSPCNDVMDMIDLLNGSGMD